MWGPVKPSERQHDLFHRSMSPLVTGKLKLPHTTAFHKKPPKWGACHHGLDWQNISRQPLPVWLVRKDVRAIAARARISTPADACGAGEIGTASASDGRRNGDNGSGSGCCGLAGQQSHLEAKDTTITNGHISFDTGAESAFRTATGRTSGSGDTAGVMIAIQRRALLLLTLGSAVARAGAEAEAVAATAAVPAPERASTPPTGMPGFESSSSSSSVGGGNGLPDAPSRLPLQVSGASEPRQRQAMEEETWQMTAGNWNGLGSSDVYYPRCTALLCTALRCTAPHRTAQRSTAQHSTSLPCTALHCTALQHITPGVRVLVVFFAGEACDLCALTSASIPRPSANKPPLPAHLPPHQGGLFIPVRGPPSTGQLDGSTICIRHHLASVLWFQPPWLPLPPPAYGLPLPGSEFEGLWLCSSRLVAIDTPLVRHSML